MNAVDRITEFLSNYCEPLLKEYEFRVVNSCYDQDRPDVGSVLLESEDAQCYFAMERGVERSELLLYLRSKYDPKPRNWIPFSMIKNLLSEETSSTALMDESKGEYLRQHIAEIVALFGVDQVDKTLAQLDQVEKKMKAMNRKARKKKKKG